MEVHVICCNDSVEYAVIGNEDLALKKLEELKAKYFERNRWSFRSEEEYSIRCYWHIHTVSGEVG